jgi:signal transduction histidine kinase
MEEQPEKHLVEDMEGGRRMKYNARYLLVSVTDTGKGIEQNDLENVFNPFFTTKKDGTGLGLPISYGIVNQHGGEMEIKSHPEKGTTITIKLPQNI